MKCSCKKNFYIDGSGSECKCKKHPTKEHCDDYSNSAVIENSGNSKNHIKFQSLAKSKAESSVRADAGQDQDQRIDF